MFKEDQQSTLCLTPTNYVVLFDVQQKPETNKQFTLISKILTQSQWYIRCTYFVDN